MLRKILTISSVFLFLAVSAQSTKNTTTTRGAISVRSTIINNNIIKLNWYNWYNPNNNSTFTIFRKERSANSWNQLATVPSTTFEWTDNSVQSNVNYEYRVKRNDSGKQINAYVSNGISLEEKHYRGRILLLIDSTYKSSLSSKITQTENDLIGDGWSTRKIYIKQSEDKVAARNKIYGWYAEDPQNSKGVFIIGHVPVYPTGNINPDGHNAISWATDAYYGDMDNSWSNGRTTIASQLELFVGRIDFFGINKSPQKTLFPGKTQTQLLSDYLDKLHGYKRNDWSVQNRALIKDNFHGDVGGLCEIGYRNMGALFPSSQINDITVIPQDYSNAKAEVINKVKESSGWIMGYFGGGGFYDNGGNQYTGLNSIFDVYDLSVNPLNVVFSSYVGSYVGNWGENSYPAEYGNLLKVALASGKALVTYFNGLPNWTVHNMGMGEPIGYSMKETVNNYSTQLYPKQNGGWQSEPYTTIHLSILGDPTLRMSYIKPVTTFNVINNNGQKCFSWDEVSGAEGYNLYSLDNNNVPTKINNSLITSTDYTTYSTATRFMVRTVKTITNNGTYKDMSIGTLSNTIVDGQCGNVNETILDIKAILGGAVQGDQMRNDIEAFPSFPSTSPYGGSTQLTTNNVVDWVRIDILNGNNCSIYNVSGLLKKNGELVGPDGNKIRISIPLGSYFIKIDHRNHFSMTSQQQIQFINGTVTFDFSTQPVYGGESAGIPTTMGRAMIPGDINKDGKVKYTGNNNDRETLLSLIGEIPTDVKVGYYAEDVNLNGRVSYTGPNNDRELILTIIGGEDPTVVLNEKKKNCQ